MKNSSNSTNSVYTKKVNRDKLELIISLIIS